MVEMETSAMMGYVGDDIGGNGFDVKHHRLVYGVQPYIQRGT
jgi:hypothetical protein